MSLHSKRKRGDQSSSNSSILEDVEEDDDEEDEFKCSRILEAVSSKSYTLDNVLSMERRGKLNIKPVYQRSFKWKQKQSSLFVESLLISYPCPEVTFLRVNEKGDLECLDGQQRLTTLKQFTEGNLAESWKNAKNATKSFELKSLAHLVHLENKAFKELTEEEQSRILDFEIRCCIIPESWPFANVIDYFKRIQGGGTKMTNQELRRVMTRGAFTQLLDDIAESHSSPYSSLTTVFENAKVRIDQDEKQELYLRFFTLQHCNLRDFGCPSVEDHMIKSMKKLNEESKTEIGTKMLNKYVENLRNALELTLTVFTDECTIFQRPVILADTTNKAFYSTGRINKSLWDCILYVFATKDKATVTENSEAIHDSLITLMQTHDAFTSKKLQKKDTQQRINAMNDCIDQLIQTPKKDRQIYGQERNQIIKQWLTDGRPCAICNQKLSKFHEFCHVDHAQSLFSGGSTVESNLVVTHKICNLKKGK